jgi:hypothetical protein
VDAKSGRMHEIADVAARLEASFQHQDLPLMIDQEARNGAAG